MCVCIYICMFIYISMYIYTYIIYLYIFQVVNRDIGGMGKYICTSMYMHNIYIIYVLQVVNRDIGGVGKLPVMISLTGFFS
jgi:hypothetical protein